MLLLLLLLLLLLSTYLHDQRHIGHSAVGVLFRTFRALAPTALPAFLPCFDLNLDLTSCFESVNSTSCQQCQIKSVEASCMHSRMHSPPC